MAKRRLAILRHAEEITGNVALTCRYYGISRQAFYKWRQRYDQHGLDGGSAGGASEVDESEGSTGPQRR
jgi:transposase-like protein